MSAQYENSQLASAQTVLQARQVSKQFADFKAVKEIDFTLRQGECLGLLGPNGAGKSTLINMIYGAIRRTSGELRVFGFDPTTHARQIKAKIGVVTQENALDESLTVKENMMLYASFVKIPRNDRENRVRSLLLFMNLAHKEDATIQSLSGGMKRRLVFVRALLSEPELLILDEPTTGLDPAVRQLLWGKVNELKNKGKTVIVTTHYMQEAEVLCDRVIIMNQGQIVAEGHPASLRDAHTPGYVAVYDPEFDLETIQKKSMPYKMDVNKNSSGIYVRSLEFQDLLRLQKDLGRDALLLRPAQLEDVFLKLTGQELTVDA